MAGAKMNRVAASTLDNLVCKDISLSEVHFKSPKSPGTDRQCWLRLVGLHTVRGNQSHREARPTQTADRQLLIRTALLEFCMSEPSRAAVFSEPSRLQLQCSDHIDSWNRGYKWWSPLEQPRPVSRGPGLPVDRRCCRCYSTPSNSM